MPSIYYLRQFYPGSFYHIYNRGAHKQNIFHDKNDYQIFTQILAYYLLHPNGTAKSILNRLSDYKVPNLVIYPTTPIPHIPIIWDIAQKDGLILHLFLGVMIEIRLVNIKDLSKMGQM